MSEVNEVILKKLRQYPPEVAELAIQAVRLAADQPPVAVAEQLEALVRLAVRNTGANE